MIHVPHLHAYGFHGSPDRALCFVLGIGIHFSLYSSCSDEMMNHVRYHHHISCQKICTVYRHYRASYQLDRNEYHSPWSVPCTASCTAVCNNRPLTLVSRDGISYHAFAHRHGPDHFLMCDYRTLLWQYVIALQDAQNAVCDHADVQNMRALICEHIPRLPSLPFFAAHVSQSGHSFLAVFHDGIENQLAVVYRGVDMFQILDHEWVIVPCLPHHPHRDELAPVEPDGLARARAHSFFVADVVDMSRKKAAEPGGEKASVDMAHHSIRVAVPAAEDVLDTRIRAQHKGADGVVAVEAGIVGAAGMIAKVPVAGVEIVEGAGVDGIQN